MEAQAGASLRQDVKAINDRVRAEAAFVELLFSEIGKIIVGQRHMVERVLIGLFSDGHVLLEGVPGLAKTLTVSTLAEALQASFKRIQFTPDLLPADLVGTLIYRQNTGEFAVNVMHANHVDALYSTGMYKGAKVSDKWEKVGLTRESAEVIKVPLVAEAIAVLECRVAQVVDLGQSSLLVAQIVAASANPQHWRDGGWFWDNGLRLLHHLSGADFGVTSEPIRAKKL